MTTKTRAQLIDMVAEELRLVGDGQSLEDSDSDKIDSRIDGVVEELAARGVVELNDLAEIPAELAGALATCVAVECSPMFEIAKDYAARSDAEDRIRIIDQRKTPPNQFLQVDSALRGSAGSMTYARWLSGG